MKRYQDLNSYFKTLFGERVQKITVDAGLTCPNRDGALSIGGCIYCNARGSGTGNHAKGMTIAEQLEQGKAALSKRYKTRLFMAYFQSFSNTYAPVETLERLFAEALAVKDVVGLSIGTRPDCINEPVLALLEAYAKTKLIWVEYGLQSANDQTLIRINRGHDLACFQQAVKATKNRGIKICAHLIIGLPGETADDVRKTADVIAKTGIDGVKLHVLYVIRGTVLHDWHIAGRYQCLTQEEYVKLAGDVIARLPTSMVIQRLTGDPHPDELAAPEWTLRKMETLNLIRSNLERRNIVQGCSIA